MQAITKLLFRTSSNISFTSNVLSSTVQLAVKPSYYFGITRAKADVKERRLERRRKRRELKKALLKPKPEPVQKQLAIPPVQSKENHPQLFQDVTSYYLSQGKKISHMKLLVLFSRLAHLTEAERDINHPAIVGMVQRLYGVRLMRQPALLANFMKYAGILNIRDANLWRKFLMDVHLTDFSGHLSAFARIIRYMSRVSVRDPEIWDYMQSEAVKHLKYQKPLLGKEVPRDFLFGFLINKVRLAPDLEREVLSSMRYQAHMYSLEAYEELLRVLVSYSFTDEELWTLFTRWINQKIIDFPTETKSNQNSEEVESSNKSKTSEEIISSIVFNLGVNLSKAGLIPNEKLYEGFYNTIQNYYKTKQSELTFECKRDLLLGLMLLSTPRPKELHNWASKAKTLFEGENQNISPETIKHLSTALSFSNILSELDQSHAEYFMHLVVSRRLNLGPNEFSHLVSKLAEFSTKLGARFDTLLRTIAYYLAVYPNHYETLQSLITKLNEDNLISVEKYAHLLKPPIA